MTIIRQLTSSRNAIALLVALFSFAVYRVTLAPTVGFIDSGELATVACTLGVAHPTGYPFFTLLAWVFSMLPIASEPIVRLHTMAAVLCAAGVFVFFQLVHFLLTFLSQRTSMLRLRSKEQQARVITVASVSASFLFAFSETYWGQAVSVEVYSLHALFLSLVSLLFFKAALSERTVQASNEERITDHSGVWWLLFAFTVGLSFTNHMTTILLAPGFVYLYFATQGSTLLSWRRIARMALPFVLGLSVYLYLPVRASQAPVMNWGDTATFEKFLWHISGKQFRVWIFSSTEAAGRQLTYFFSVLPAEFAYVGLAFALVGAIVVWRMHRKLSLALLLLFVTCLAYSINYDIHDIDSYFLLAYFSLALWASVGILWVIAWLSNRLSWNASVTSTACVSVCLVPLVFHFSTVDESKNYLVEDYTMNMFSSLPSGSLVLSYQWDYWVSASYYYQLVKGVRPDLVIVDKELLRRSWYLVALEHRYPRLMQQSRREVEAFGQELFKFEHELPYRPEVIQARYVELIQSFIQKSLPVRPVFVTSEIEPEFTAGLQRVPEGLAFRLVGDTSFHPADMPRFRFRPFSRTGRLESMVSRLYAEALVSRGLYYSQGGGSREEAENAFRSALLYDSAFVRARGWLGNYGPR